ncbi:cytochrome bd oxidase small subunit CydS [Oceanobacillus halophilus]
MLDNFMLFIAPVIIALVAIVVSFWAALKDSPVTEEDD